MASTESSRAAHKPKRRSNPLFSSEDEEEAERTLVSNLELRRQNASKRSGWDASVEGEHPPLPGMPMNDQFLLAERQPPKGTSSALLNSMSKQWNIARGVKALGRSGKMALMKRITEEQVQREPTNATPTTDLLSSFRLQKTTDGTSSSRTDIWVESAMKVNDMLENERGAESEEKSDNATSTESSSYLFEIDNSTEPLLPTTSMDSDPNISSYGATGSDSGGKKQKKRVKKLTDPKKTSPFWCLPRSHFGLAEIVNPAAFIQVILRFLFASTFTFVTVPCLFVAAILFHYLGNPSLSFLPGDASLSWWLIFIARQALILELVIVIQYLAVEGIALRTKWMVYTCGPLVTLWFINAKGWPLMAILWSLLDLGLLHGDAPWQQNWLYYLDIPFFSSENSGGQIVNSDFYLRILLSALLAGCCHAIKRTHVALAFGRSTFLTYMAPLEQILADIVLITEVAELASELQTYGAPNRVLSGRLHSLVKHNLDVNYQAKGASDFEGHFAEMNRRPSSHNIDSSHGSDSVDSLDDDSEADSVDENGDDGSDDGELSGGGDMEDNEEAKTREQVSFNEERIPSGTFHPVSSTVESFFDGSKKSSRLSAATEASVRSTESTTSRLKQQLDRWQEPQNKLDKSVDVSIADILKFRKALTYMDDPFPFGFSFGPGATRNQVIRSSRKTYKRLIRSANLVTLSYDVIMLLAITEDGSIDAVKDRALKRLFRPDHHKQLTLLSFVQTCDTVYKKLRYFRASVGNASVINKVLESIVDSIVNFFLALVIMTILEYNPYPVLVSLSTVMVSLAFAVGSSASKYIEVRNVFNSCAGSLDVSVFSDS
jgi:hypothetical protein